MPTVSIITPVYNSSAYIEETARSIFDQSFQDFEWVVVDDGSTDKTAEIIRGLMSRWPDKIHYFYQKNGGPAKARNRAIQESKGKILAIIDADDLWIRTRLEKGIKILDQHPDIGLTYAKAVRISSNGEMIPGVFDHGEFVQEKFFEHLLTRKVHIPSPTVLLRRSCIEKVGLFDESPNCIGVEDRDLWLRISQEFKVGFSDEVLAHYRIHPGSISKDFGKMLERKEYVIEKNSSKEKNPELRKKALAELYRETADSYLIEHQYNPSKEYYRRTLSIQPFSFRTWINYLKAIGKIKVKHAG